MKKFFLVSMFIILSMVFSGYYYYNFLLLDLSEKKNQTFEKTKQELLFFARQRVEKKNLNSFEEFVQHLQRTTPELYSVTLELNKHLFSDKLLKESTYVLDSTWDILEVSMDDSLGTLMPLAEGFYEVLPTNPVPKNIILKFQAVKNSTIKDFIFSYETKKIVSKSKPSTPLFLESLKEKEFTLQFDFDRDIPTQEIEKTFYTFLFILSVIVLCLVFIGILVHFYFIKPKFLLTIKSLQDYLQQILDGKMVKDSSLPTHILPEFDTLHESIIELTKKYVNAANELSISKDIIFQKERTDELTGLPNKKSFENDVKYMFISNKKGFIVQLRIDKIGIFTKNHGPEIVDTLIEDFAHTIKHFFNTNKMYQGMIYRFFGGEFAMIVYDKSAQEVESMLKNLISLSEKLNDKYYFFDNHVYYGATPFDKYGSIESILQSAQDAYETAFKEKTTFYFIADDKNQNELNLKLENTVKDIIARNDFVLQYLHDTYSFKAEPTLLMQEVSPLIIDSFTFESVPSGKFISVAEKLGFISDFDKAFIEKTLEQIQFGELTHKIGIVLSVSSLSNQLFLSWLEELFSTNENTKNLIFVAPGYSIASNYETFKNFCKLLASHHLEFMVKRYDPTDLPLEKLKDLQPQYIRLERTFCQDFKKDSSKQHVVKQILLFADEYGIKVVGDSVKNEQDYLAFETLGFFGTSR